jgi:hypothetical protein
VELFNTERRNANELLPTPSSLLSLVLLPFGNAIALARFVCSFGIAEGHNVVLSTSRLSPDPFDSRLGLDLSNGGKLVLLSVLVNSELAF